MAGTLNRVEWVKPARQARSQETLERLLDAAEEIVSERGFDNATVAEIVRRANSSVGAMYARFADKDSLLVCLHERFCEQALATADMALEPTRWAGASIADILAVTTPFLVHTYHHKRGLIRAFIARCSCDPSFAERGSRLGREIASKLLDLLADRYEEIKHPHPELAIDFGLRMIFDTLDHETMYADFQRTKITLTREQLAEELTRAFLSYLGVATPQAW
ncbi:MAG: TetR/AcrR family transcriptional regulator [Planctomycetota bacterium]|nr:MAG: TetR/AcrR family transcriptional regulator [Planctomycetota bacterium]